MHDTGTNELVFKQPKIAGQHHRERGTAATAELIAKRTDGETNRTNRTGDRTGDRTGERVTERANGR